MAAMLTFTAACTGAGGGPVKYPEAELLGGGQSGDFEGTLKKADEAWSQRQDRAKLEEAINLWEQAITLGGGSPDARRAKMATVYAMLARAKYFLADAHIRFESDSPMDPDEATTNKMKGLYVEGYTNAEKSLALVSPEYNTALKLNRPLKLVIPKMGKDAVPGLYWFATNLGRWGLAEGMATALDKVDDIKLIMDHVIKVQPDYFHNAPSRYFGSYYTKLPFPTGDLPQSKKYFDIALKTAPQYLGTSVLYASMYATKVDDEDLYKKLLDSVIKADPNAGPADILPENMVEQKKAKLLIDDF